ncbi:hypothetical protein LEMLEM_LOCUS20925 [Lemmus lemmus]
MAQQVKALAADTDNLSSVPMIQMVEEENQFAKRTQVWFPEPIWQPTTFCNSSCKGSDDLFWLLRIPGYSRLLRISAKTLGLAFP